MYDLSSLSLPDIIQLGNKFRKAALGKNCLEEVARELVGILYNELAAGESGKKACGLVRFFKTHNFEGLEPEQKDFAQKLLPRNADRRNVKCLTLVATAGDLPEWNSRAQSRDHKAIPLISEEIVANFPMISNLFQEMGLDIRHFIRPDFQIIRDELDKTYGVFFISDAVGSPSIPAQENFVVPHGIKSVLGIGGVYPTGDVFCMIQFFKIGVPKGVAQLFQLLSLYAKIATYPFHDVVFQSQIKTTQDRTPLQHLEEENQFQKFYIQGLESVFSTHENLVEEMARQKDLILNSAGEGIYGLDLNGNTTFINPAAESMLGYSLRELIGKPQHATIHHSRADGSPYPRETCPIYMAFKDGKIHHETEEVFWRKDGRSFPVEYISRPIREEGRITGAVVTFRDITEPRGVERKVRESRQMLQTILDSLPVRVFWKDRNLNYLGCNRAFAEDSGWTRPQQLIGKDDFAMSWKANAEALREDDRWVIETGRSKLNFEEHINRPDGTRSWLRTSKVPLKDLGGRIIGVLGAFENITQEKEAREKLQVSEERMEQVIDSTGGWVWEVDPQGLYTYSSPAIQKLLGYRPEYIVGKKHFYDFFMPEKREEAKHRAFEVFSRRENFTDFVNEVLHRDGHRVVLSTNGVPLLDPAGNFLGYRGVDIDISERQRMLDIILESEEKYRSIFEGESDAFFLLEKESKRIREFNRAARELFGYSREELLELKITDLSAEPEKTRKAVEGLNPGIFLQIQTRWYRKKDGAVFPVEISAGCFLLSGKEMAFGALRDISDRKTAEDRMLTLNRAIEQSPLSIMITDSRGGIEYVNPHFCELTGYSLEECLGKNPRFLRSGEHSREFYQDLWGTVNSGKIWQGEIKNRKKNGEYFWESAVISPVKVEGRIAHFVGIKEDVTRDKEAASQMKTMQKQLLASEKLAGIGQLAAGVSHEVLNPVNIISVHTQMLARKREQDEDLQRFCGKVRHEIDRIEKIMGALLTFSRKGDSRKVRVTIREVVDGVMDLVERDFALDNIKVERGCAPEDLAVSGDKDKLRQVFLNLVRNAKYAMPGGGTLSVGCRPLRRDDIDWIEAFVADTGTGIKKENLEKLFMPFFTTKPEGEGTGMGLAMVHGIVEEHGGAIRVETEEGRGTKFIIEFPRA